MVPSITRFNYKLTIQKKHKKWLTEKRDPLVNGCDIDMIVQSDPNSSHIFSFMDCLVSEWIMGKRSINEWYSYKHKHNVCVYRDIG